VYTFYAVVHRDLKDRIVFLDCFSRCLHSFIGRIRGFRLPIHLEAKSAAVSLLALNDRRRGIVGEFVAHDSSPRFWGLESRREGWPQRALVCRHLRLRSLLGPSGHQPAGKTGWIGRK